MEFDVLKYFLTQGPFAVLFVWLFLSTRKEALTREVRIIEDSRQREAELQSLLHEMSSKYGIIIERLDGIERRIPEGGE